MTPYDPGKGRCRCLHPFLRAPKLSSLSQWQLYRGCRGLRFILDFNDQLNTLVFVWCFCLFGCLFLCIFCIILYLKLPFLLLKAFPNCHSVCHQTTNMHVPFSTYGGSSHGSLVFIRFRYPMVKPPTHNPKSLDHFLLTKKDRPHRLDQRNVHYITSWRCNILAMGNNTTTNPPKNVMT